jgi:hypothetical protein
MWRCFIRGKTLLDNMASDYTKTLTDDPKTDMAVTRTKAFALYCLFPNFVWERICTILLVPKLCLGTHLHYTARSQTLFGNAFALYCSFPNFVWERICTILLVPKLCLGTHLHYTARSQTLFGNAFGQETLFPVYITIVTFTSESKP